MLRRLRYLNVIVLSFCALVTSSCVNAEDFQGTELTNQAKAHNFSLHDQYGRIITLKDLRGKVVALTFLYTYCTDICPVVTDRMKDVHSLLKDVKDDVVIVAVSIDSERDTQERTLEYSQSWNMEDKWSFLSGDEDELSTVWQSYFINPIIGNRTDTHTGSTGPNTSTSTSVAAFRRSISSSYLIEHSAPVYLIDREGKMRIIFTLPFKPESLAHDIRLLLNR